MTLNLLIFSLLSLCSCLVNSQDVRPIQRVPGPDILVTDGTRNLTLICPAESSGGGQYTWLTPGNDTTRCARRQSGKVCIFTPRLEDDDQNVTCTLIAPGPVISTAFYQVNLKYPPQSSPNITIKPPQTEPLKQGDVITCTVFGGKPRVTNITFHCRNPINADQKDDVSADGRTVSSSIKVDTSQATEQDMICSCEANWPPEPELYPAKPTMSFKLEYKAVVTKFTVNATRQLTVNETSHSTVEFKCQGDGRPSPVLRLSKQDIILQEIRTTADMQTLLRRIDNVRGEDMGSYRCEADNGFSSPNRTHVTLLVDSAPRILDKYSSTNPPTLPPGGLTFEMVAYPTPSLNVSYFLGNGLGTTRVLAPENSFQAQFTRNITVEHLVNCHVTPHNVPEEQLGLYEMYVTNRLGDASFGFRVESPVAGPSPAENNTPSPAVIGGVSGAAAVVAVVIVAVVIWKYRNSQQQQRGQEQPPNPTPAAQQESYPSNQHVEIGNPYEILQRGQEDDGRTYTELMLSSTTKDGNYVYPVNN